MKILVILGHPRPGYGVVVTSSPVERAAWPSDVRSLVQNEFPPTLSPA
jgi:hypothetical protein